MHLEDSAGPRGRDIGIEDFLSLEFLEVRPHFGQVSCYAHIDGSRLATGQVEQVQRAKLLVDDRFRSHRRRLEVQPVVLHHFRYFPGRRVIRE